MAGGGIPEIALEYGCDMSLFERGRDLIARVLPIVWVNEAITLLRRSAGDAFPPPGQSCNAKRSALDNRDTRVQLGLVPAGTVTFILNASDLTSPPRQHDKIVDATSLEWTINFVQFIVMDGEFYRCEVTAAR